LTPELPVRKRAAVATYIASRGDGKLRTDGRKSVFKPLGQGMNAEVLG